jgi:hypothetical protein
VRFLAPLVKTSAAAGATSANCSAAKPSIVSRQPKCASVTTKIGAQIAADTDEPLPSKANAVPRRRSNQRVT